LGGFLLLFTLDVFLEGVKKTACGFTGVKKGVSLGKKYFFLKIFRKKKNSPPPPFFSPFFRRFKGGKCFLRFLRCFLIGEVF